MSAKDRKTVFLLGAGASKGSMYQLPCMAGFFEEEIEEEALERFLQWFYKDTPRDKYNLEEVLSYLELARTRLQQWGFSDRSKFQPQALFEATLRYVRKRLELPAEPAVCNYHHDLCKRLRARDTIITLNYDLIVDKALFALEGTSGFEGERYARDGSRTITLKGLVDAQSFGGGPPITLTTYERQSGFYLKLHGSLNWLHCPNADCQNHQRIFSLKFEGDNYSQREGEPCRMCGAVIQPFLVAPMPSKQLQEKGRLRILWRLALQELADADRIVVVGLSFAASDFELRWLAKQAMELRKPTHNLELHVVDPFPNIQERVQVVFGIKAAYICEALNSYLGSSQSA